MTKTDHGTLFIGIDIGTSSVKALMSGPGGERVAAFSHSHTIERPAPGAAEQDPELWLARADEALERFSRHPRAAEVAAIGVTSQVNTHVFCDADGRALRPAITWQDTRAKGQADALDQALTPEEKIAALGAAIPIDASHALSRMSFVAETEPEVWEATRHVLLPKDYAIAALTGEFTSDPISAVGLVGTNLAYAPAILGLFPRADELLPQLRDPLALAGKVRMGRPFSGVPVAVGTMDAWAGMFGLGVAVDGQAMYLSGTSEVIGLISAKRVGAPGIITFPDWRGITLHAGPTQSGGASMTWVAQLLGRGIGEMDAMARGVVIGKDSPLFLPHLAGERAPLWDPTSRGSFAGMTGATGPKALVAATMEGVAFSARLALEAIDASGGLKVTRLRHGGGGAASDAWCQIRANALGRTLDRVATPETGALGALVMAGVASGQIGSLEDAARTLVATDRSFEPDPAAGAIADARFAAYQELYRALGPVNAMLR